MNSLPILILFSAMMIGLASCTGTSKREARRARLDALEKRMDDLKPGFGEIMGVVQQHHAKLFYSGMARNWPLAAYQINEIKEGLEDIVKYHPNFEGVALPITELVAKIMTAPLASVEEAIRKKDKAAFEKTYGLLTKSCNSCHQAAQHPFIVVQIPKGNEFTNQKFSAE